MSATIRVEVACALPDRQRLLALDSDADCSVQEVVRRSGILDDFPEIDAAQCRLGIWGQVVEPQTRPRDGDRIEIYRPLLIDPKAVRQARADARAIKPKRLR